MDHRIRGTDLRDLRRDAGLSQAAIARWCGLSRSRISQVELAPRPSLLAVARELAAIRELAEGRS